MATPDFVLASPHVYQQGMDVITLPAGTFVRPIEDHYVPTHILDDPQNKYRNSDDVFCYTPRGILLIPKRFIKSV